MEAAGGACARKRRPALTVSRRVAHFCAALLVEYLRNASLLGGDSCKTSKDGAKSKKKLGAAAVVKPERHPL